MASKYEGWEHEVALTLCMDRRPFCQAGHPRDDSTFQLQLVTAKCLQGPFLWRGFLAPYSTCEGKEQACEERIALQKATGTGVGIRVQSVRVPRL